MEKRTAVLLLVAMFLVPMGLISAIDEAEASPGTIFVGELIDDGESIPDADVYLRWFFEDGGVINAVSDSKSNEDGAFEIVVPSIHSNDELNNSSVEIMCKTDDHVRVSQTIELSTVSIEDGLFTNTINLDKIESFPIKYIITPSITVEVFVEYNNVGIDGARVVMKDMETGVDKIKYTGRSGTCEFELPPGNYEIAVEAGGFIDYKRGDIELGKEATVIEPIQLELSPVATYWGLDLPHLLMMIGLTIALILTISILLYMLKVRNHHGFIRVVDDSPDDDDEYDDKR